MFNRLATMLNNIRLPWLVAGLGLLFAGPVAAATSYDVPTILANLRGLIEPIIVLILTICFIAGIYMIFRGLGMFKQFGMPLTQMSRPGELGGPLVYILVGVFLIYLPTSTDMVANTIFGESAESIFLGGKTVDVDAHSKASEELLGYLPVATEEQWADVVDTIVMFIQLVGFIAFVRGWFLISKAGQPGVQPGTVSKGIIHLVGGIIAVNFVPFMTVLANTVFGT